MAAVDQEEIDAVNNLKAAHELISSSLQNDLLMLQKKHRDLSTDFDEQKTQLVEALLSKDRLMQDLAATKDRSGSTDDGQAQAKAIIEAEEKLKEVSRASIIQESLPIPKMIFERISRLFTASATHEPQHEPRAVVISDVQSCLAPASAYTIARFNSIAPNKCLDPDAELALELSALGFRHTTPPLISPRMITLPPSPTTPLSPTIIRRHHHRSTVKETKED